jgi:eukaryotic-like serine/threonine-protein kinase
MGLSQSSPDSPRSVRFGVFEVDLEGGELRKSGLKIALQVQPFRVLRLLLENPGKVVTREEIQQQLWTADTFVEFDRGLNTAITKVREALGDSAVSPRFIETVPRRGYRFLVPVENIDGKKPEETVTDSPLPQIHDRNKFSPWLGAITGALVTAIGVAVWAGLQYREPVPNMPLRKFNLAFENLTLDSAPAISPDARHIAFITQKSSKETRRLRVYDLDRGESHEIANTDGAQRPFWSPDSEFVGFAAAGELRKVSSGGGVPIVLCQFPPDHHFDTGTWSPDGNSIVFAAGPPFRLYEVPARGGHPKLLVEPLEKKQTTSLLAPQFLPAGPAGPSLLFVSRRYDISNKSQIMVHNLASGREQLLDSGEFPVYSPTGHIIYQTSTCKAGIWTLPFSLATLAPTGEAFPVARIAMAPGVARDGTFVSLDGGRAEQYRLIWLDVNGKKVGEIGQPQLDMMLPSISPDGRFVGVEGWEATTGADVWIHDISQSTKTRFTRSYPSEESRTIWSPDGKEIAFWSDRTGNYDVYIQRADGSGEAKPIMASPRYEWPEDWSADGNYIVVTVEEPTVNRCDIWYLKRKPDGSFTPTPFLATREIYRDAAKLSPDGRFLAYVSDESGRLEVWVSPFPQGGRKWQVSRSGGTQPRWSKDGKKLFYVQHDTLLTVAVSTKPTFSMGGTKRLFAHPGLYWHFAHAAYDVSADGKRFVVIEPVGSVPPLTIRVVENWFAEFRDRKKANL